MANDQYGEPCRAVVSANMRKIFVASGARINRLQIAAEKPPLAAGRAAARQSTTYRQTQIPRWPLL